ncbi:MAG: hypothetical protein SFT93_03630 [Rickettsiaceae bacterium]|nr:hypothetical protein [Rickettsiaceae bacterium]
MTKSKMPKKTTNNSLITDQVACSQIVVAQAVTEGNDLQNLTIIPKKRKYIKKPKESPDSESYTDLGKRETKPPTRFGYEFDTTSTPRLDGSSSLTHISQVDTYDFQSIELGDPVLASLLTHNGDSINLIPYGLGHQKRGCLDFDDWYELSQKLEQVLSSPRSVSVEQSIYDPNLAAKMNEYVHILTYDKFSDICNRSRNNKGTESGPAERFANAALVLQESGAPISVFYIDDYKLNDNELIEALNNKLLPDNLFLISITRNAKISVIGIESIYFFIVGQYFKNLSGFNFDAIKVIQNSLDNDSLIKLRYFKQHELYVPELRIFADYKDVSSQNDKATSDTIAFKKLMIAYQQRIQPNVIEKTFLYFLYSYRDKKNEELIEPYLEKFDEIIRRDCDDLIHWLGQQDASLEEVLTSEKSFELLGNENQAQI